MFTVCTDSRYEGQNAVHIFGTDNLGRDLFVRAFEGGRVSLMIAFSAVFVNLIIGMIYGGISGYFGGMVDNIMMRIVEVVNGIPYLIVVVLLMMVLPKGIFTMVVAYATVGWSSMARLVRGQCLILKEPRVCGGRRGPGRQGRPHHPQAPAAQHPVGHHHQRDPGAASAIFTEAFLSYIGMGVAVPQPSWGMAGPRGASVFQLYPWRLWFRAIATT